MVGIDLEVLIKGIIRKIANEYNGFPLDKEDLLSEGYLIATEQMLNYDYTKGASVETYLYTQVLGRLRNYVSRVELKATYGTEVMQRVSMENVDREVSTSIDLDTNMALNEFRLSLEPDERVVFDALRVGYTYREISSGLNISTGYISKMVRRWGELNGI